MVVDMNKVLSPARVFRLLGNFIKLFGYVFHALFPKKRFALPAIDAFHLDIKDEVKIPKNLANQFL